MKMNVGEPLVFLYMYRQVPIIMHEPIFVPSNQYITEKKNRNVQTSHNNK